MGGGNPVVLLDSVNNVALPPDGRAPIKVFRLK